jgi:membrane associated rhomboid family serine protease
MSYYRPEGPQALTPMVKNLLIINVVLFVIKFIAPPIGNIIDSYGALHFPGTPFFVFTQFVTYMFLHGSFFHILFNMFGLYMFGTAIERVWGWKRFLNYYLACGLGAAVFHVLIMYLPLEMNAAREMSVMVGASGAIYGLLVAFGFMYPNNKIYVYFMIPIKAKYFVVLLIAVDLLFGFSGGGRGNVAHFAHVGGAVTGILFLLGNKLRR